eukprot:TRINITY_DN4179_c2_g1_i2.p1 TRINITY_DN4179_c2_g1~~TRINITY_DN4179_c2_g1_i2.p1  ORF type:complete len:179 (-),score=19.77 TRINITY_DN4179_c2_g1_i2:103-639(-)
MCDPDKQNTIWRATIAKELATWKSPANILKSLANPTGTIIEEDGGFYRMPANGESITISGMRRRPDLNGAQGEVVNSNPDEFGRVTVRVYDQALGDSRRMKIQPFRLVPSSSSPALHASSNFQDDRSSVRSLSRAGSVVSVGSRALGSTISLTAKSALSNTGHTKRLATPGPSASQVG